MLLIKSYGIPNGGGTWFVAQCYDIPWPHRQTVNWDDIDIATSSIAHLVAILHVITVSLMA